MSKRHPKWAADEECGQGYVYSAKINGHGVSVGHNPTGYVWGAQDMAVRRGFKTLYGAKMSAQTHLPKLEKKPW